MTDVPSWGTDDDDGDGASASTCRFCFETGSPEEDLIAPCACTGSQKYIHVQCLKKWQAHQVLQAASSRGLRIQEASRCSVCHAQLSSELPSEQELLELARPNSSAVASAIGAGVLLISTKTGRPELPSDADSLGHAFRSVMLKRAAHWYSCVFLMHEVQEAAARDGSDAICGVNLTREIRVDDRGNVTGICDAEVISATELAEMIFGKHMLLRKAVKRARSVGVVVRDFIGGPCKTTEVLAIHTEPTVADSSAVAGIDGLRFGGPPTGARECHGAPSRGRRRRAAHRPFVPRPCALGESAAHE